MRVLQALLMTSAIAALACGGNESQSGEPSAADTSGDEQVQSEGQATAGTGGSNASEGTLQSEADMLEGGAGGQGTTGPGQPAGGASGGGAGVAPGGAGQAGGAGAARRQQAQAALKRALGKAAKAAEGDGSTCERAYRSTRALVQSLRDDGMVRSNAELAPQERFVSACEELPDKMQQCMLVAYAQSHPQECVKARNELSPEKVKMIRDMMGPSAP